MVKIAENAIRHARDYGSDMVFLDTAGRLHVDKTLMDELKRMKAAVHPNEILLVVDAMTGQDAVNVAESFNNDLGLDGVILTKMDGTAKGGIAVAIQSELHVPVKYIGVGEKIEDLQKFDPDQFVNALFDTEKDEVY